MLKTTEFIIHHVFKYFNRFNLKNIAECEKADEICPKMEIINFFEVHAYQILKMMALGGLGLRLCPVNGSIRMIGRRVDGIQLQRSVSGIDQIMPRARRYENSEIIEYRLLEVQIFFRVSHQRQALTVLHAQKLIDVRVNLQSNVASDGNAHQSKLQMVPCPQGGAKRVIVQRGLRDVRNERGRAEVRPRERRVIIIVHIAVVPFFGFIYIICRFNGGRAVFDFMALQRLSLRTFLPGGIKGNQRKRQMGQAAQF